MFIVEQFKKRTRTYRVRQVGRRYATQLYEKVTLFLKLFRYTSTFDVVETLAREYALIPIVSEYYADMETPISVFKKLQTEQNGFLLESVDGNRENMRYSFIGRNPFIKMKSHGKRVFIHDEYGEIHFIKYLF